MPLLSQAILPDLSQDYPLFTRLIASYQQQGHVVLRGVASPEEIAAYRPILAEAVARYKTETRPMAERDTYGKAFLQVTNIWERDEAVRRFVMARRFAKIAADLMGVDGVRLYHDQALFKEPGGGRTPWHQDQYYWPMDTSNTITMWMPLVDVSVEMGVMSFASGSQRHGYLGKFKISDESDEVFQKLIAERGLTLECHGAMAAGDATFHSGWTLHNADGNSTGVMREVTTIIYLADGARILEPDHQNREEDLKRWFPGLKPGDLAASSLNPLLYKR